ncbi:uncharacterized protein DUF3575 [Bacteroides heparinolyticus]|uniref:Uncharacterized protein DUF3575 n=1 Tax=Prevotella heparinolytica TaxID=28113 RepID=A0A4R2LRL3_9BACE|nr:DUF3575 domain-containing protein [Bacteroides heparinolyticus]TCO91243.1 uncharacterized protein DUF3575 [Bacteroides heparinolyticus]
MKRPFILFLFLLTLGHARGQEADARRGTDSVRVYFRQGDSRLDPYFRDNGARVRAFTDHFRTLLRDPSRRILGLRVTAGASPEGSTALNHRLSEQRAEAIRLLVSGYFPYESGWLSTVPKGIDWEGLERLAAGDEYMPYRHEVLDILRHTPEWITQGGVVTDGRKRRLAMLGGGYAWRYMEGRFFPELRASTLHVWYESDRQPAAARDTLYISLPAREPERQRDTVYVPVPAGENTAVNNSFYGTAPAAQDSPLPAPRKPFYMAVKTNLLYDAVVVPNLGLEFYLGRGWSIAGNWMYTWLKNDNRYRYHRVYGGDLEVRRWLSYGRKPLTGHHMGIYGLLLTYDLEWGGKGYLGDRWSYGGGISYGYSAPIGRRLNLDFTLGIGYLDGEYYEYVPQEGHYVWKATKKRRWFGPTKAEVSLVWLIGHGNTNPKKGGKR